MLGHGLSLKVKIFGHGLGIGLELDNRPCYEVCVFLQQWSINFLQKTINHFITVHVPRK